MTATRLRVTAVAFAAGLALLLAACGAEDRPADGTDEVLTLVTATPTATGVASPVPSERPLVRPDASKEEEDRLHDVFFTCLRDNGATGYARPDDAPADDAPPAVAAPGTIDEAADAAAQKACEHLEPEAPWQRAQRTDPHYADKLRDWITCVRSHGIDAFESDGFLSFESLPSDDKMKHVDECEMKAFDVA